jgi:hypothetical protein
MNPDSVVQDDESHAIQKIVSQKIAQKIAQTSTKSRVMIGLAKESKTLMLTYNEAVGCPHHLRQRWLVEFRWDGFSI